MLERIASTFALAVIVYLIVFRKRDKPAKHLLSEYISELTVEEQRMLMSLINSKRLSGAPWADEKTLPMFYTDMVLTLIYNDFDKFSVEDRELAKSIRRKIT